MKNLDDNIDDERLRKEFAQYGNITSAKVSDGFYLVILDGYGNSFIVM